MRSYLLKLALLFILSWPALARAADIDCALDYAALTMKSEYVGEHLPLSKPFFTPSGVTYLNTAEDRAPYLARVAGGVFRNTWNLPYNPLGLNFQWHSFVISLDGALYMSKSLMGQFHHSSFFAGGPVLSAGSLYIRMGKLRGISAHSGHYRPDTLDFFRALRWFRKRNVSLKNLVSESRLAQLDLWETAEAESPERFQEALLKYDRVSKESGESGAGLSHDTLRDLLGQTLAARFTHEGHYDLSSAQRWVERVRTLYTAGRAQNDSIDAAFLDLSDRVAQHPPR